MRLDASGLDHLMYRLTRAPLCPEHGTTTAIDPVTEAVACRFCDTVTLDGDEEVQ